MEMCLDKICVFSKNNTVLNAAFFYTCFDVYLCKLSIEKQLCVVDARGLDLQNDI